MVTDCLFAHHGDRTGLLLYIRRIDLPPSLARHWDVELAFCCRMSTWGFTSPENTRYEMDETGT